MRDQNRSRSSVEDVAEMDEYHTNTVRKALRGYRYAQVYIAFAELGIADCLDPDGATIEEVAECIDADPEAMKRFLAAADAFDLVEQGDNGRYVNSELSSIAFVSSGDKSLANMVRLEGKFFRRWSRLSEAVRLGTRPRENREDEASPDWIPDFTRAIYENARQMTARVAEALGEIIPDAPDRSIRLLDLGGGHGGYSIAIAREHSNVEATVYDVPAVIAVTEDIIQHSDTTGRVFTETGDFHQRSIGEDWDIVLLFGVLHGETPEGASRLLTTIFKALKPGGRLLIRQRGTPQRAPERGERELTDLHMLLSTDGGSVGRRMDIEHSLRESGFDIDQPIQIHGEGGGHLLIARRPA